MMGSSGQKGQSKPGTQRKVAPQRSSREQHVGGSGHGAFKLLGNRIRRKVCNSVWIPFKLFIILHLFICGLKSMRVVRGELGELVLSFYHVPLGTKLRLPGFTSGRFTL